MRNGTQEELDAAREDATLLPFDALFLTKEVASSATQLIPGKIVFRGGGLWNNSHSVAFYQDGDLVYMDSRDLEVINA